MRRTLHLNLLTCMRLLSDLQLDFVQLVPTFEPSHSASFQCNSLSTYLVHTVFYENVMGHSVESLPKVRINNAHCSPPSRLFVKGCHVAQASFPLCKPMLTTPRHLFVLRMLGNGFEDGLQVSKKICSITLPGYPDTPPCSSRK